MSSTLSVNGIGHGIFRAPTLKLSGASAKPTAEDQAATQVAQANKPKGIGKPNPLNQIKDQAEADATPASEKGSTGNKTLIPCRRPSTWPSGNWSWRRSSCTRWKPGARAKAPVGSLPGRDVG
ncbi:hypothetical protein RCF34_17125 [Pseudomonas sp. 102515]|uniref:hypothetical protein n=1 Tax=Pseudomonas sp. 102515 TaxID=3071568 RepID=UPI00280086F9|nr:hypothetical protein [Pseudomonas sp. 102515]MDQ7914834.1 hypothetical protein [Pseudomonas sp. 102515]